jgi:Ras-related protein Rab-1A
MESDLSKVAHDYMFSIIIIGDQAVGKTSLMVKFAENQFKGDYKPTIGIDFKVKKIKVNDNTVVKLQVWDTAGQERFRTISQTYYQRADGVILAYDCSNSQSHENLTHWVN